VTERRAQRVAALAILGLVAGLIASRTWLFDGHPHTIAHYQHPTIWQLLLADRIMVGFAHLAIIALVVYIVISVPALAIAGRWLKGFGTSLTSDDVVTQDADSSIKTLQAKIRELTEELDDAENQIDVLTAEREEARGVAVELHAKLRQAQEKP